MREVVKLAGYRITSETGSALVAAGDGSSFSVWTTEHEAQDVVEREPHWRRLAMVDGTPVYGDEHLWRFWEARGFVFWVKQGPTATAVLPTARDLGSLIEASKSVPPPRR